MRRASLWSEADDELSTLDELTPLQAQRSPSLPGTHRSLFSKRALSARAALFVLALGCVGLAVAFTLQHTSVIPMAMTMEDQSDHTNFDSEGRFIFDEFNDRSAMSSFLPGVAGVFGKPLWVFYVNRGQAIASFGYANKDTPILEFNPANKAFEEAGRSGFRTFIRAVSTPGEQGLRNWTFEPLSQLQTVICPNGQQEKRTMLVGMNEIELVSECAQGLRTRVRYFQVPNEDFPGLVRQVTIENLGTSALDLEVLDGVAWMQPAGINDYELKNLGRTLQSWSEVLFLNNDRSLPFYHQSLAVNPQTAGNFVVAWQEQQGTNSNKRLPIVAWPHEVFGQLDTNLEAAPGMASLDWDALSQPAPGPVVGCTATAFAAVRRALAPGDQLTINSVYGQARDEAFLLEVVLPRISVPGFLAQKRQEAVLLTHEMTMQVGLQSQSLLLDGHIRQSLLDNTLRGGYPLRLDGFAPGSERPGEATKSGGQHLDRPKVYYVFSRRHGDLERDYNTFVVQPEFFSSGPGNFRDLAQNRRSDVLQNPWIQDYNLRLFLQFIQADGYNPLEVKGSYFYMAEGVAKPLAWRLGADDKSRGVLTGLFCSDGFNLGQLFTVLEVTGATLTVGREDLVATLAKEAELGVEAAGGEGYWIDHWTYLLDLVDTFRDVYPDRLEYALFDSEPLAFFNGPLLVLPRDKKYVLKDGKVKQTGVVWMGGWNERRSNMWKRAGDAAKGPVFKLPVVSKLFFLAVIKFATLDPLGMGVEMEAGKPGWLDSMDTLPTIFGSGMPETFELLRLVRFLKTTVADFPRPIVIHSELDDLLTALDDALRQLTQNHQRNAYWHSMYDARETYRMATIVKFSGQTVSWSAAKVAALLSQMATQLEEGIQRALSFSPRHPIPPTYFSYYPTDYSLLENQTCTADKLPCVRVQQLEVQTVPLFLEGAVRMMKVMEASDQHRLYNAVANSPLLDPELGFYKISESIAKAPKELGRVKAFPAGWLENESVWLHMAYKWLLQLLRAQMFPEFWRELQRGCTAFMDPHKYGRNPLECSSFIVSSAYPNTYLHGQGFTPRLSGSTAEMLSMYHLFTAGPQPFAMQGQQLVLRLRPALPSWIFKQDGSVLFTFMGCVDVTVRNPSKANTWELQVLSITVRTGNDMVEVPGHELPAPWAEQVRNCAVSALEVRLAGRPYQECLTNTLIGSCNAPSLTLIKVIGGRKTRTPDPASLHQQSTEASEGPVIAQPVELAASDNTNQSRSTATFMPANKPHILQHPCKSRPELTPTVNVILLRYDIY
eukprot:g60618.t1